MTLRALDMYDKLLLIDGLFLNHPNYDYHHYNHQIVKYFMNDILSTPRKRNFKNQIIYKTDTQTQSSRKYVPSDGSRKLFQERIKLIEDKQKQLWFTYRRPKFSKKKPF